MIQFKAFVIFFLAFFVVNANAQIAKGNYSFDGSANIAGSRIQNDFYRSTAIGFSLNPSVSKFVTDKWLVGCQPLLDVTSGKFESKPLSNNSTTINSQALGLSVSTRYYFGKSKNTQFFGALGLGYAKYWRAYSSSNNSTFKDSDEGTNFEIGLGASTFINSEIAFESRLLYQKEEQNDVLLPFGFDTRFKTKTASLNFQFNNFINLSGKGEKEDKDAPQNIRKGRQIATGQVSLSTTAGENSDKWTAGYSLNPTFGQFVTNNLLLKGDINLFGFFEDKSYLLATAVSGRYYFPISKKFYLYPEVSVRYSKFNDGNSSSSQGDGVFSFGSGLGGSYFLSNNIAIDATILSFETSRKPVENTQVGVGVQNIRLLYFIR